MLQGVDPPLSEENQGHPKNSEGLPLEHASGDCGSVQEVEPGIGGLKWAVW